MIPIHAKVLHFPSENHEVQTMINQWNLLSVQSVYLLNSHVKPLAIQDILRSYSGDIWVIFQLLLAKENEGFPIATLSTGQAAVGIDDGSWLEMLCPRGKNSDGITIIQKRFEEIKEAIQDLSPVGISLDFIRTFIFWENIEEDRNSETFPRSCFCEKCQEAFFDWTILDKPKDCETLTDQASWILKNHSEKWEEFTAYTISQFVHELVASIREVSSSIEINLHLLPWMSDDFDGALKRVAGQNIKELSSSVSQFSPMCYAPMMKRPFSWIPEVVENMQIESENKPIIPAIQISSMYGSPELSNEQFESMISETSKTASDGIILWPWETITKSQLSFLEQL